MSRPPFKAVLIIHNNEELSGVVSDIFEPGMLLYLLNVLESLLRPRRGTLRL